MRAVDCWGGTRVDQEAPGQPPPVHSPGGPFLPEASLDVSARGASFAATRSAGEEGRSALSLSLFDGAGAARVALDLVLHSAQVESALAASWLVEIDPVLSSAMERSWQRKAQLTGVNVWDLLRNDARRLRT
eukprot:8771481-Alexandrium_andersonii.AAC.1